MKKLLITGFEPFGGEEINPSWEAVSRMPSTVGEYSIVRMRLPVEFKRSAELVISEADKIHPDVILCIGQAGGRDAITPELVGINLRHAELADNVGYKPCDEPISSGGDAAYFSTLPVRRIARAINESGIPSRVSYSAGAYVCNDLLYSLLLHFKDTHTRVGFIHIPYCKEQNKHTAMDINDVVKGLTVAVESLDDSKR